MRWIDEVFGFGCGGCVMNAMETAVLCVVVQMCFYLLSAVCVFSHFPSFSLIYTLDAIIIVYYSDGVGGNK